MPKDEPARKRMVVEEVGTANDAVNPEPADEIKEKVEELQTITQDISESVEKSEAVQEDLAKAVEVVAPVEQQESPKEDVVPEMKSGGGPNPLVIIVPGIFLLGALLGGIVFYQRGISNGDDNATPTPANYNNLTASPSAPPEAQVDLTKYPINVMNGSGTPGQAGAVKDLLTTAGFSVTKTGNAPSYDFTKTVIKAKVDVPAEFLTKLSTALSKSYVLDTNQPLATSSAASVQVIVGSTKTQ